MTAVKKMMALLMLLGLLIVALPCAFATEESETTAPTEETVKLNTVTDLSQLELQVATANGLNAYDYTAQSWEALQKALDTAKSVLKGKHGQWAITNSADNLEKAIAGLVKMDYTKLEAALAMVAEKVEENPVQHEIWFRLDNATEAAEPLLVSGNQPAVDEAVTQINGLLEELAQVKPVVQAPEVVVQEVEVEVLPKDDYCNIPMHRTWPVLFVISAVLNVVMIVMAAYVIVRKRTTEDNTPLVSYDIEDDMDF